MTESEAGERLVRLETQVEGLRTDLQTLTAEAKLERKEMMALMQTMRQEITHYKGVIGGISLVFSGIVVALGTLKAWFLK